MLQRILSQVFVLVIIAVAQAVAAEPLIGTWTLSSQMVNGQKVDGESMTLRIYPVGDGLEFAYSMPVNGIHLVSLKFTSVHLDGTAGSVQDVRGNKMGTVKVTKVAPLEYKAVIEGPNRPKATGKMSISQDNKTLTSESDTAESGKGLSHAVQVFSRH